MTTGLKRCAKKQLKLYRDALKSRSITAYQKYKDYRDILKRTKRSCKQTYYHNLCVSFKSNTKKLWDMINKITKKTVNKSSLIHKLNCENIEITNSKLIANELNSYFATVGKNLANKIRPGKSDINSYLNKMSVNEKSLFLYPTNICEVSSIIDDIAAKASSGFDGLSNRFIKSIKQALTTPLTVIFNKSLETGIFPDNMKKAEVVPLHKGGKLNIVSNYRPISLLLTLSKILEKIVYKRTYCFLSDNDQLYQSQYGFRKKHSCEHAIAELLGKILKSHEKKEHVIAIFLDLSKAFDTLDHNILFKKLEIYGIRGVALSWFKSYLSNRCMRVKCKIGTDETETKSDWQDIEYGTPQGSNLGPLLFLIFCNDLYKQMENCSSILFADDTTVYKSHRNLNYLKFCIETDLKLLNDWFKANKLTLNVNKSVCMVFANSKKNITVDICIDNIPIKCVENNKFLGVWVDNKLNWHTHVNKLTLKLKRNIHLLRTGRNMLDVSTKRILYFAHIQSHLCYGISLWGNMISKTTINKLQKIQDRCIALIEKRAHAKQLNILDLPSLIVLENMKFGFKVKNGLLPCKILDCFYTDQYDRDLKKIHKYATRYKTIQNLPRARTTNYLNSIFCKAPQSMIGLEKNLIECKTYELFVKKCKCILLK